MKAYGFTATASQPFKIDFYNNTEPALKSTDPIDQSNDYLKSLINQYRQEITLLKKYIEIVNKEIRQNLNIQIPTLDEGFITAYKKLEKENEIDQKVLDEWLSRLMNVEYIMPLITLYETHKNNLEEEIKECKKNLMKYDKKISDLITENSKLRTDLEIRYQEMQSFFVSKANSEIEAQIVVDKDYVGKLEERCSLLSKENEILALNYQKAQKENFELKSGINSQIMNINDKANKYDQIAMLYDETLKSNEALREKLNVCEVKVYELNDKLSKMEIENHNLRDTLEFYKKTLGDKQQN